MQIMVNSIKKIQGCIIFRGPQSGQLSYSSHMAIVRWNFNQVSARRTCRVPHHRILCSSFSLSENMRFFVFHFFFFEISENLEPRESGAGICFLTHHIHIHLQHTLDKVFFWFSWRSSSRTLLTRSFWSGSSICAGPLLPLLFRYVNRPVTVNLLGGLIK